MTADDPEAFTVVEADLDGRPLIASINLALRESSQRRALPWFLGISTPLSSSTDSGLPTRHEAADLDRWETQVERVIAARPFSFVGRVTWNCNRELLYYLQEPAAVVDGLQALIKSETTRPFAFRCERDDDWHSVDLYMDMEPFP